MLAELDGVPAVVLSDRMACLKAGVVANVVVPHPEYVQFAAFYGFKPDFCEAADPESKPRVERQVPFVRESFWTGRSFGSLQEINVAAVRMPVLTATDLTIAWLASFSEHHADFAGALSCVRPLREQVDWSRVRAETAGSAFATAFLVLLRELRILTSEEEEDEGRRLCGGSD